MWWLGCAGSGSVLFLSVLKNQILTLRSFYWYPFTDHHWLVKWDICLGSKGYRKMTPSPATVCSPCCHLAKGTKVSAAVPPDYRAASQHYTIQNSFSCASRRDYNSLEKSDLFQSLLTHWLLYRKLKSTWLLFVFSHYPPPCWWKVRWGFENRIFTFLELHCKTALQKT